MSSTHIHIIITNIDNNKYALKFLKNSFFDVALVYNIGHVGIVNLFSSDFSIPDYPKILHFHEMYMST